MLLKKKMGLVFNLQVGFKLKCLFYFRYLSKGRQLVFGDDSDPGWGPGWEYTFGLGYTEIDEKTVQAVSTSLISEPDFIISSAAGMHYCDLLSPYRALEWIYITGVQHGKEFKKLR